MITSKFTDTFQFWTHFSKSISMAIIAIHSLLSLFSFLLYVLLLINYRTFYFNRKLSWIWHMHIKLKLVTHSVFCVVVCPISTLSLEFCEDDTTCTLSFLSVRIQILSNTTSYLPSYLYPSFHSSSNPGFNIILQRLSSDTFLRSFTNWHTSF